jgi:hypothetical protein
VPHAASYAALDHLASPLSHFVRTSPGPDTAESSNESGLVPEGLVARINIPSELEPDNRAGRNRPPSGMLRPVATLAAQGLLVLGVALGGLGMWLSQLRGRSARLIEHKPLLASRASAVGLVLGAIAFTLTWFQFCLQLMTAE